MKTVYQDENSVVQVENSVEWKPCINRVCKSLKLFVRVWYSQLSYTELYDCQYELPSYCESTHYLSRLIRGLLGNLQDQLGRVVTR